LIVEVHAPDDADIKSVHAEAEITMKEKFGGAEILLGELGRRYEASRSLIRGDDIHLSSGRDHI
jgi:hypothetical protein